VLRARTTSETRGFPEWPRGFMKPLVEADGGRILGFAMLGAGAATS